MEEPIKPSEFLLFFILIYLCLKCPLPHPCLLINSGFITGTEPELALYSGNKQTRRKQKKSTLLKYKGESQESGEHFYATYL